MMGRHCTVHSPGAGSWLDVRTLPGFAFLRVIGGKAAATLVDRVFNPQKRPHALRTA